MQLIACIWLKILKEWWQFSIPIRLRAQGVELGKDVRFYGMPIVSMEKGSRICLGDRVVLCSDSRFTALGVNHPVLLRTLRPGAAIIIGNDTGISGSAICAAMHVEFGDQCLLGANVTITDTDFHAIKPTERRFNSNPMEIGAAPIKIEDNVFIGAQSIVLKGVRIGTDSVIGAGSVVVANIPAGVIAVGNPARIIRPLIAEKKA